MNILHYRHISHYYYLLLIYLVRIFHFRTCNKVRRLFLFSANNILNHLFALFLLPSIIHSLHPSTHTRNPNTSFFSSYSLFLVVIFSYLLLSLLSHYVIFLIIRFLQSPPSMYFKVFQTCISYFFVTFIIVFLQQNIRYKTDK